MSTSTEPCFHGWKPAAARASLDAYSRNHVRTPRSILVVAHAHTGSTIHRDARLPEWVNMKAEDCVCSQCCPSRLIQVAPRRKDASQSRVRPGWHCDSESPQNGRVPVAFRADLHLCRAADLCGSGRGQKQAGEQQPNECHHRSGEVRTRARHSARV
jgi:hypothetical protein